MHPTEVAAILGCAIIIGAGVAELSNEHATENARFFGLIAMLAGFCAIFLVELIK